jgi:hypothetical protein
VEGACPPEIHVKAPPQQIQINIKREKEEAPRPVTQPQPTRQQVAQEVVLVPRTVYVPYVAQTPVAPVRMLTTGPAPVQQPPAPVTQPPAPQKQPECPPVYQTPCPPPCPPPKRFLFPGLRSSAESPDADVDPAELNQRLQQLELALQRLNLLHAQATAPAAPDGAKPPAGVKSPAAEGSFDGNPEVQPAVHLASPPPAQLPDSGP